MNCCGNADKSMANNKKNQLTKNIKKNTNSSIQKIKELFPNAVKDLDNGTLGIDFDLLKQELSEYVIDNEEKYQLTWYGKKELIKLSDTPTTKTLKPIKNKSVDFENTKNIYIEGDNLDALKILQNDYLNKINCIYIDPPYNTGNDFIYNDNFSNYNELKGAGLKHKFDRNNAKLTPEIIFHSNWLSMIYPRLKLSRNLLTESGIIFISINDIEQANLKKICDEIFGERNFIAQIIWTNKEGGGGSDTKLIKIKHEYILCYAKQIENAAINGIKIADTNRYIYSDEWVETRGKYQLVKLDSTSLGYVESLDYPITAPDGSKIFPNKNGEKISRWRWSKEKLDWGIKNGYLEIKKDKTGRWIVYSKQYLNADPDGNIIERTNRPLAVIDQYSSTQASKQLQKLLNGKIFDYSKPVELIKHLLNIATKKNDLVLDFFSGSAATAQAVLELNAEDKGTRQYIMVQLPEKCRETSEAYKNGYKTICDIGEERIRRAANKIKSETNADIDYGFKVYKIDSLEKNIDNI